MTQRKMFQTTCFGWFLGLVDTRFSVVLIHIMLFHLINRRDITRKLCLRISGVNVRFNLVEFAMVTGLVFKHNTDVSTYIDYLETP